MNKYEEILSAFHDVTVGVIGDVAADVYIMGYPDRLSREAPVIVVRYEGERLIPGCAANTMNNLLAMGCTVYPVSIVGDDEHGRKLIDCFRNRMDLEGMIHVKDFNTVSKTRIMVGEPNRTRQQMIRIDYELDRAPPDHIEADILDVLEKIDPKVDAWLVSDYNYHVITPAVADRLTALAASKPVVVDSRFRSGLFKGVRCMTPNEGEAKDLAGISSSQKPNIEQIGWKLMKELDPESLIITRGNNGMMVFERNGALTHISTVGDDEVVDVSGAGDTVAATITASLVAGADTADAARIASCAAGVVVMKTGAATCTVEEIKAKLPLL
ncbi:MAG: bifunctional ADP-heptose synthase [Planctomycetota bacterium]